MKFYYREEGISILRGNDQLPEHNTMFTVLYGHHSVGKTDASPGNNATRLRLRTV